MLSLDGLRWSTLIETASPSGAHSPEVSPNGRWLAYALTGRTGANEVWVQPFPGPGQRTMVSSGIGGSSPAWNPRGGEIFYVANREPNFADPNHVRYMMAVRVTETPDGIEFGTLCRLFDTRHTYVDGRIQHTFWGTSPTRMFDVASNGETFLAVPMDPQPPPPPVTHINVIYNWVEELKAKVPTGR